MITDKKNENFITLALFLAGYATNPSLIAFGLLLVDIANTFQVQVGLMSQINTTSSLLGILTALIMSVLSIKYKHKILMQVGLVFIAASALGCFYANDYLTMMMVYSLFGVGAYIVNPMTRSLVGEYFSPDKQGQAIGLLIAGSSVSYLISAPLMAYITNISGWRNVFLFYIFPVTLISIILSNILLPKQNELNEQRQNYSVLNSFKAILSDSIAISYLLGIALLYSSYQAILVFSASFYREVFNIDRSGASNIVVVGALLFTIGSVGASRIIQKYGKKKVILFTGLIGSIFIGLYANMPDFGVSITVRFLGGLLYGVSFSGLTAMLLGQIPQHRGTLMSLNSATSGFGATVGTFIGGILLLTGGYSQVTIMLAFFGIIATIIVYLKMKNS
ncbi:MFS transporter [Candidatus Bathyarchaeota archaeon]|nr:MFS transporter [Candidatus Bathyarchaeota archaeon]